MCIACTIRSWPRSVFASVVRSMTAGGEEGGEGREEGSTPSPQASVEVPVLRHGEEGGQEGRPAAGKRRKGTKAHGSAASFARNHVRAPPEVVPGGGQCMQRLLGRCRSDSTRSQLPLYLSASVDGCEEFWMGWSGAQGGVPLPQMLSIRARAVQVKKAIPQAKSAIPQLKAALPSQVKKAIPQVKKALPAQLKKPPPPVKKAPVFAKKAVQQVRRCSSSKGRMKRAMAPKFCCQPSWRALCQTALPVLTHNLCHMRMTGCTGSLSLVPLLDLHSSCL